MQHVNELNVKHNISMIPFTGLCTQSSTIMMFSATTHRTTAILHWYFSVNGCRSKNASELAHNRLPAKLPVHTMQVWSDVLKHTVNTCIILEVVTNKLRPLIFSLILLFLVCTLHIYYLYLLKIYYSSGQTQYTFCLFSSGSLINCWFFCTKMVENVVQVISLKVRLWRYTQHEIAKDLHIFRCAVQNALKLPTANGNRQNCGHNPKTTSRDDQYVKMLVKQST